MNTPRLIKFASRALARGINPIEIYVRAKGRFAASHSPARIRQILRAMGILIF